MHRALAGAAVGVYLVVGQIAYLCVRGIFLWITLPLAALTWLLAVIPSALLCLVGVSVPLDPRRYLSFGRQFTDAVLSRVQRQEHDVPWPWQDGDGPSTGVVDML